MNELLATVLQSQWTPATLLMVLVAVIVTSFARGWIVSKFQVKALIEIQNLRITEAIRRGDEYKQAWEAEAARNRILSDQVDKLTVIGDNVNKILSSLPRPGQGG